MTPLANRKYFIVAQLTNLSNTCREIAFDNISAVKDFLHLYIDNYLYNTNTGAEILLIIDLQYESNTIHATAIKLTKASLIDLDQKIKPLDKYLNMIASFIKSLTYERYVEDEKSKTQITAETVETVEDKKTETVKTESDKTEPTPTTQVTSSPSDCKPTEEAPVVVADDAHKH